MCGIFAAIGDATDEALTAATTALAHRGPDAHGVWRDGTFGLAHTRLKVIDLSEAAAQPMAGCDPQIQVAFNGEIYNHRELRAELERLGHRFRSRSDTEAIVHGYEAWGDAVVRRLDGMFAFALWDGRKRRLLAARDRSGKKPLFYTVSPDGSTLRLASEVKALVAAGHDDALDVGALPMYLAWGYVPAPATLHAGVRSLSPATALVFSPGQPPQVSTYWQPGFRDRPLALSFGEALEEVRRLTIAAVQRRLESDVPMGAFLSGGLDSTIVVGIMSRLLGQRVRTFSIGFAGDPDFDETDYAREAAHAFGTEHTEFRVEPDALESIDELVWLHDGPFGDSSAIPTRIISRLMRRHVTVALSGDGGDELFAGYLRFLAAEAAERIPRAIRRPLATLGLLLPGGLPHYSLGARARRFLQAADRDLADRTMRWSSIFGDRIGEVLRPEWKARLDIAAPLAWHRSFFTGAGTPLQRILDHNFRAYLAYDLQQKLDRCSAGNALEVRSPFLDTALIDFASRLPDGHKRRGRTTKRVLREAFADLVPPRILRRGKMGFGVPLATWFRGDLRATVEERLRSGARVHEYLDARAVGLVLDEHLQGRADRSPQIWSLLTLEIWLRRLAEERARRRAA